MECFATQTADTTVENARRVLLVDDDRAVRWLLRTVLKSECALEEAGTGEEALEKLVLFRPGIVVLDISMPGIDGYETCRRIKTQDAGRGIQIIMLSAESSRAGQLRAYEAGADDYVIKPFDPQDIRSRVRLHFQLQDAASNLRTIRQEIDARNSELKRLAEQRNQEVIAIQDVAVFTLAKVAESRDQETGGHLTRMRAYSQILAEELARRGPYASRIDQQFLDDLYRSSPLHDIGKVGIRDEILLKPGRLTREEFEVMQQHAIIGANILDQAVARSRGGGFLKMAAVIARFHHERFDGSGYPAGLVGEEIPLPARIVAVADVYDALTSARPYKPGYPVEQARQIILSETGRHFDPVIVDAFQRRFHDLLQVNDEEAVEVPMVFGAMAFREYDLQAAGV
jgi:response regulator RpfG family c-di-GMP phosphodiesterase